MTIPPKPQTGRPWYESADDVGTLRFVIRDLDTRVTRAIRLITEGRTADALQLLQSGDAPAGPVNIPDYKGPDPDAVANKPHEAAA